MDVDADSATTAQDPQTLVGDKAGDLRTIPMGGTSRNAVKGTPVECQSFKSGESRRQTISQFDSFRRKGFSCQANHHPIIPLLNSLGIISTQAGDWSGGDGVDGGAWFPP